MKYSIVIPAYNGDHFLERAILSAINQTQPADEILVHDDNSTDTTRIICERYASQVRYFLNKEGPSGFVDGWNSAIQQSKGDYICILHQDDLLYPTFLEEADKAFKKHQKVRHLFAVCNYINENDEITATLESCFNDEEKIYSGKEYVTAYQKTYNGMPHIHRCPGVITHRSIFEEDCRYNAAAGHIADDDFFYRVGQYTDVIGLLRPLAAYRIHSESETGKIGDINLVKRLAQDYAYQLNQWKDSDFLDSDYFEYWALKYLVRLNKYYFFSRDLEIKKISNHCFTQLKEIQLSKSNFKYLLFIKLTHILMNNPFLYKK